LGAGQKKRRLPRLTAANFAFLLLLWLAETFIGERHWLTTLLAYVPQHPFGLPTVILLMASLVRRKWVPASWNGVALIFFAVTLMGLRVPLRTAPAPTGTPLRVMTFNIEHGAEGVARIAAVVRQERPDVLCLQEVNGYQRLPDPLPELRRLLPGWHAVRSEEVATFSRLPILSERTHRMPARSGRVILETVLQTPAGRLTVLNVHLSTATAGQSLARRASSLPVYLRLTAAVRAAQVAELLRVAERASPPLVVAGDFNTPPRGLIYRRMAARFQDAFAAAGSGLGYTYPANGPVLRIDYLFAGEGIAVQQCAPRKTNASDHRPLVAEIVIGESATVQQRGRN
jgi:vancomycin resistance protein VanJ